MSKMTKPQLKALVEKTAPPDDRSAHNETRPKGDLELEPDEQGGGHYFSREGKTRSKGAHEHKKNPWPATDTKAPAAPKPASPKKKKKKTDLEDPEATVTPDLAERRLNKNRHPATGAKLKARGGRAPGVIAERMRFLLRGKQIGTRAVNAADIKDHLFNIDAEYAAEFPDERGSRSGIDTLGWCNSRSILARRTSLGACCGLTTLWSSLDCGTCAPLRRFWQRSRRKCAPMLARFGPPQPTTCLALRRLASR